MTDSPTRNKRQASQPVNELENVVKRKKTNDGADLPEFVQAKMKNIEDIIGPQFCSLCDRNIAQSVKIRSTN